MNAPIRSMAELVQALRNRRDELDISHETIDTIAGLQSGYTSKLLAPKPIKNLGPVSFESIMGALGLAVVVVEDQEQVARVKGRWQGRKRRPARSIATIPDGASIQSNLQKLAEILGQLSREEKILAGASKGGKRRAKLLGKRTRQRIASHAARARWARRNLQAAP